MGAGGRETRQTLNSGEAWQTKVGGRGKNKTEIEGITNKEIIIPETLNPKTLLMPKSCNTISKKD